MTPNSNQRGKAATKEASFISPQRRASSAVSFLDRELPREPEVIELLKKLVRADPLPPH